MVHNIILNLAKFLDTSAKSFFSYIEVYGNNGRTNMPFLIAYVNL